MKNKNNFIRLIVMVVFLTNISQLPIFVKNGITKYFSFPGWIIFLILLFLNNRVKFGKIEFKVIFIGLIFMIGVLIAELSTPFNHLSSNLIPSFYISLFILMIGLFSSDLLREKDFLKVINAYIASMLIVSIFVFREVFSGGYNWLGIGYSYGSKNSLSQMIFIAMIFLIFLYTPKESYKRAIKISILGFWAILLLALKSRATILALFITPFIVIGYSKRHLKWKVIALTLTIGFVLLIYFSPSLKEIVVDGVLLGSRGDRSLNEISSGRIDHLTVFFPMWFNGNELFGTGTYYVESFPFNALLKHGILVGWILIFVAYWPMVWAIKNKNSSNLNIVFTIVAISYFLNSLFEAQAPFGPGTKNYILWLMFGILYGAENKSNKIKNNLFKGGESLNET